MKTDELVSLLAADTAPLARAASRQIAIALLVSLPLAALVMQLGFGVRADFRQAVSWPMFWVKVLAPCAVAAASFVTLHRLARPGVDVRAGWIAIATPIALLWLLAFATYLRAPDSARAALVWGQTWRACALNIAQISVPVFVAVFVALKHLAPPRLALAGACAGALAGAAAAAVYAFHCPEMALPFIAIWYVAGIALPTVAGALLGPRLLRW